MDLDDERTSVITDVEGKFFFLSVWIFCFYMLSAKSLFKTQIHVLDEETGCYASYQCVLPMQVHGADYAQMGMISNVKAEKLVSLFMRRNIIYV